MATVTLTVIPVDDIPTISGTPALLVFQDQAYSFTPSASDPDAGDTLTFSITPAAPGWAAFDTATGAFTGTPTNADLGSYGPFTIRVTDSTARFAELAAFSITVDDVNDAFSPSVCSGLTTSAPTGEVTLINENAHSIYIFNGSITTANLLACIPANNLSFKIDLETGDGGPQTIISAVTEPKTLDPAAWSPEDTSQTVLTDQVLLLPDRNSSWTPQDLSADTIRPKGTIRIDNRIDNILRIRQNSPTTGPILGYAERGTAENYIIVPTGRFTLFSEILLDSGGSEPGVSIRLQIEEDTERTWLITEGTGLDPNATRLKVKNLTNVIQIMFEGDTELIPESEVDSGGGVSAGDEKIFAVSDGTSVFTALNDDTLFSQTQELTIPQAKMVGIFVRDVSIEVQPPEVSADSVTFTDTDSDAGELGGDIVITSTVAEDTVFTYVVYWGSDSTTKLAGENSITTIQPSAATQTYTFPLPANTAIPTGATHILVFTANTYAEQSLGISVIISDL